jgi:hypothetical protein
MALFSGLDLDSVAYTQTAHLEGMHEKTPPPSLSYWAIVGTPHTFSIPHFDGTNTAVYAEGDGEKIWITSWERELEKKDNPKSHDLRDAYAFVNWDPDHASTRNRTYEAITLPPRAGTLYAILFYPGHALKDDQHYANRH